MVSKSNPWHEPILRNDSLTLNCSSVLEYPMTSTKKPIAPTFLYLGSKDIVTKFEPKEIQKSDLEKLQQAQLENNRVIWASPDYDYALSFAALHGKVNWEMNQKKENRAIRINNTDWKTQLNKDYLDSKIYIYKVTAEDFVQVNQMEYISIVPVEIIDYEEYSVRSILQKYKIYAPILQKFD